jgi:hypothetical protein
MHQRPRETAAVMRNIVTTTVAVAAVFALAACSVSTPPPPAPEVDAAGPSSAPDTEPTPTQTAAPTSERGNLVKNIGDTFSITPEDSDEILAAFTVTGITVDPECTGEFAEEAENGHLVKIDIEGQTEPTMTDGDFYFGGWRVIAENGTTFNGNTSTVATYSCLPDEQLLPVSIGPGERVAGSVVLDVPTASGVVVLPIVGNNGWEWVYPAE